MGLWKVHQSYLLINWVRELLIHIIYESHEQPTLNPAFSNPIFIDLENSPVWKKKERGTEPSCSTTTSYKLSYPPHRLTEARLASLEKVHKLWRSKWGTVSCRPTPYVYMYICICIYTHIESSSWWLLELAYELKALTVSSY